MCSSSVLLPSWSCRLWFCCYCCSWCIHAAVVTVTVLCCCCFFLLLLLRDKLSFFFCCCCLFVVVNAYSPYWLYISWCSLHLSSPSLAFSACVHCVFLGVLQKSYTNWRSVYDFLKILWFLLVKSRTDCRMAFFF